MPLSPERFTIRKLDLETGDGMPEVVEPFSRYEFWSGDHVYGHHYTPAAPSRTELAAARDGALAMREADRGVQRPAGALPASISVVICTRDRPDELARCLASFRQQTRYPDEIIVVDNASRDGRTREAALEAGVTYVREDRPGLDIARNTGAASARFEIVAYTDDDVILHDRWVERMLAAFDSPTVQAVTGLVLPAELESPAQIVFEIEWSFGRGYRRRDYTGYWIDSRKPNLFPAWELGAGASMAFRRSVFDLIGDFDPRLDVGASGCSGDSEFWYRILHHGGTCRYEPNIIAWHFHRREMAGLLKQLRAYMSGNVSSVLVQHERTGREENIRHLRRSLPRWCLRTLVKAIASMDRDRIATAWALIHGCRDGLRYYRSHPRIVSPENRPTVRFGGGRPDDMARPLVSVVIPAYNAEASLAETLDSVIAQSHANWEAIVVDDGSKDRTREIAETYAARDPRIRVLAQENGGVAVARNTGIAAARGDLVAPVDADDVWHPEKLAAQVDAITTMGTRCVLVYTWFTTIDEHGRIRDDGRPLYQRGNVLSAMSNGNFVGNASSALMRKAPLVDAGGYDPSLRARRAQGCEDFKLYLSMAERGEFEVVPAHLLGYRVTQGNMSSDAGQMLRSYELVVEEFAARHPRLQSRLRGGLCWMNVWYAVRALRRRRFRAGFALLADAFRRSPRKTIRFAWTRISGDLRASLRKAAGSTRAGLPYLR